MTAEDALRLAQQLQPTLVRHRRWLHRHPELSFQEEQTSGYIRDQLTAIGIQELKQICGTGIVAVIHGALPGKCVAIRADMDALPIAEQNTIDYKSQHEGLMHACGHDAHSACLLGVAELLFSHKHLLTGTFKLIFQPGEEQSPGGASMMIAEGVLQQPNVDHIIGLHTAPEMMAGQYGIRGGAYMASSDEVHITLAGKGGHAALPHRCIDPIPIAAQLILALQTIASRRADATLPTVLSFGKINAGTANNIIASELTLHGTLRTFDEAWRTDAKEQINKLSLGIATANGATASVHMPPGYPVLINEANTTNIIKNSLCALVGAASVQDLPLRLTSEDFAAFAQKVPACFFRLGTNSRDNRYGSSAHTPTFDIDESSLAFGVAALAFGALSLAAL